MNISNRYHSNPLLSSCLSLPQTVARTALGIVAYLMIATTILRSQSLQCVTVRTNLDTMTGMEICAVTYRNYAGEPWDSHPRMSMMQTHQLQSQIPTGK